MDQHPYDRDFLLPDTTKDVWCQAEKPRTGGLLYIPKLPYNRMGYSVSDLRLKGRSPSGKRWPQDVASCLRRLASLVGHPQLADSKRDEKIGVENALSKLREAQALFDEHEFPEPKLFVELQADLTRVRNELARELKGGQDTGQQR